MELNRPNLAVQGGANNGQTIPLTGRPITMGRRADNDVVVDDDTVSRRHALIMETGGGFVIRDLASTNGTFVNRQRVGNTERSLKHGDHIRLADGDATFVYRDEGKATRTIDVDPPRTGAIPIGNDDEPTGGGETDSEAKAPEKLTDLMRFFESREGSAASREDIARQVWPDLPASSSTSEEIDGAVDKLRERIEDDPANPTQLITVGEYGYLYLQR